MYRLWNCPSGLSRCQWIVAGAAAFALVLIGDRTSWAQSGIIQQRDQQQREQERREREMIERMEKQKLTPVVDERETPVPTPAPDEARFELKKVDVGTSAILTADEIATVTSEYEGRLVGMSDLNEMRGRLDELYTKKGVVTARAIIPKQRITDGVLRVEFVEARLGKVTYEGNRHTRQSYLDGRMQFPADELVDIANLEETLTRFNRLNDIYAQLTLQRGEAPGTTDYVINIREPQQYQLDTFIDNWGPNAVGNIRYGATARVASLFGRRDPLYLSGYASDRVVSGSVGYELPITPWDTRLAVSFDINDSRLRVQQPVFTGTIINGVPQYRPGPIVNFNSESYFGSVQLLQPLVVTNRWLVRAFVEGQMRESSQSISGLDLFNVDTRMVYGGISGDWIDPFGTTSFMHRFGRVFYLHKEDFYKYQGSVARYQPLVGPTWLTARMTGQITSTDGVPNTETLVAGGANSVRGYPEIYRVGNDGYTMSAQLNAVLPRSVELRNGDTSQLGGFLFIDHAALFTGSTRQIGGRDISSTEGTYLAGAGAGLTITYNDYITLQVAVGLPMSERDDLSDARVHFNFHVNPPVNSWLGG